VLTLLRRVLTLLRRVLTLLRRVLTLLRCVLTLLRRVLTLPAGDAASRAAAAAALVRSSSICRYSVYELPKPRTTPSPSSTNSWSHVLSMKARSWLTTISTPPYAPRKFSSTSIVCTRDAWDMIRPDT
jgi:hypothetical protein